MAEVVAKGQRRRALAPRTSAKIIPYTICGKMEVLLRYRRCKVAVYYEREHQRAEWKAHKEDWTPKDKGDSTLERGASLRTEGHS